MKVVGVTGCIGAGKSTVCAKFSELGVPVFDFDKATHRAYERQDVINMVRSRFGSSVMAPIEGSTLNFEVSRKALAKIVFSDKDALADLTDIVRPAVESQWDEFLAFNSQCPYVVCESAILLTSGISERCDMILVVTASEETRLERSMIRDKASEQDVRARMAHQMSQDEMLSHADLEIENDGEMIQPQVLLAHRLIMDFITNE